MTTNTNAASSIMELIDAYAESRHVNGAPHYNARTAEARAAVAAALASPGAVAAPDEEAARALNGAVRAEIVELLGCMGRKHLVDAAKTGPLVDVIGLLFSELSENDSEAQAASALRAQVSELRQQLDDVAAMPASVAELNHRLTVANEEIDVLRLTLAKQGRQPHGPAGWQPIATAPKDGTVVIVAEGKNVARAWYVEVPYREVRDLDGQYIDQTDPDAFWMGDDGDVYEPTHWQPERPLPPAPKE